MPTREQFEKRFSGELSFGYSDPVTDAAWDAWQASRRAALDDAAALLYAALEGTSDYYRRGIAFSIGALEELRDQP